MPQSLTLLLSVSQKYLTVGIVVYECMIVHAALELKVPSHLAYCSMKIILIKYEGSVLP